jgi:hypothetical protein
MVVGLKKTGLIIDNVITLVSECLVEIHPVGRAWASDKLFSTSAKDDVCALAATTPCKRGSVQRSIEILPYN